MKRSQIYDNIHPGRIERRRSLAMTLGMVFAACVGGPTQADLINDFEGELRLAWNAYEADVDFQVVNGELSMVLPDDTYGVAWDFRVYEIPEAEPITFAVDHVSVSDAWSMGLGVRFAQASEYRSWGGSYGFYRLGDGSLVLTKDPEDTIFLNRGYVGPQTGPETLSLTLKRQGDSLELTGTVVRRDSGELIGRVEFLDGPGVDATYSGTDSGAPNLGPTSLVALVSAARSDRAAVTVFDNWRCSQDPAPLTLTARRAAADTVAVEWKGDALLLQSVSPDGGWVPSPAEIAVSPAGYSARVVPSDAHRFFSLGRGAHKERDFGSDTLWLVGKAVPGALGNNLVFRENGEYGKASGTNLGNAEFVMRNGLPGFWWGDCLASLEIVDWEAAMEEGSAIGIVLRANPEDWTWFVNVDGLPEKHYLGLLTFKKPGSPAASLLSITGPGREVLDQASLPAVDPTKDYRLRFWAIGDRLTLELFDVAEPETPLATCAATDGRSPRGIDALYVTPTPVGQTLVYVDNFYVRGMHAAAQW